MNRSLSVFSATLLFAIPLSLAVFAAEDSAAKKKDPESGIKAAIEKLAEPDRKLVEAQRYCPVQTEQRLGSMGTPVKLEVAGQIVFLCCEGCRKKALADNKATLAQVAKVKKISAALGKLKLEDRALAESQRSCPVMKESRLGSMGTPVRIVIKGKPIFLCCEGCRDTALENPDATLKTAEALKGEQDKVKK